MKYGVSFLSRQEEILVIFDIALGPRELALREFDARATM